MISSYLFLIYHTWPYCHFQKGEIKLRKIFFNTNVRYRSLYQYSLVLTFTELQGSMTKHVRKTYSSLHELSNEMCLPFLYFLHPFVDLSVTEGIVCTCWIQSTLRSMYEKSQKSTFRKKWFNFFITFHGTGTVRYCMVK